MSKTVLSLQKISHSFGKKSVLKNISLELPSGKVYALIGPNGAGKTTLFRILTGLVQPDSGEVAYDTYSLHTHPVEARKQFVYLSDEPNVYPYLSGEEYLHLTGSLRGLKKTQVEQEIKRLKKVFPHIPSLTEPLGGQSRGNRQKILFLGALLSQPKVLLSDEPIVGLDPTSIELFGEQLQAYAKNGGSVFLALHTLDFAEKFADTAVILVDGKIQAVEPISPGSLQKLYRTHTNA